MRTPEGFGKRDVIFMDIDKLTNETIGNGGVLALLYFDLHGNTKEVIAQLGTGLVQKMLTEPGMVYAVGQIDEPMQNGEILSSSVEVKVLVKNIAVLARVCGNYSPFSIDLLRPDEVKMSADQVHAMLMDIAVNNYELKKLIIEKVYTPKDLEAFRKAIEGRMAVGKKLMEKRK